MRVWIAMSDEVLSCSPERVADHLVVKTTPPGRVINEFLPLRVREPDESAEVNPQAGENDATV